MACIRYGNFTGYMHPGDVDIGYFETITPVDEIDTASRIHDLRYTLADDAGQVRDAVNALVEVLNPSGYEGNTCTTGRCNLPFKQGGCGGMNKDQLLL